MLFDWSMKRLMTCPFWQDEIDRNFLCTYGSLFDGTSTILVDHMFRSMKGLSQIGGWLRPSTPMCSVRGTDCARSIKER